MNRRRRQAMDAVKAVNTQVEGDAMEPVKNVQKIDVYGGYDNNRYNNGYHNDCLADLINCIADLKLQVAILGSNTGNGNGLRAA